MLNWTNRDADETFVVVDVNFLGIKVKVERVVRIIRIKRS